PIEAVYSVCATAEYRYAGRYTPRRSSTLARLIRASANHDRVPSQRSSLRRATAASPVNATTYSGRGWFAAGGRSTKFGLAQYGQVSVRTPANARLAPQCPHANVAACVAT